jgi:hypothetical protein
MSLIFDPEKHQYILDGEVLPSVTQVLTAEGFIDRTFFTDYGRERGTMVHKATALDDMGALDEDSIDPILVPYLEAWRAFKRDSRIEIVNIEEPLYHKTYLFAGTPDRIGELNGKWAIIDIKHVSLPWAALQLSAYGILDNLTTAKRLAVELNGNGKYSVREYTDRKDKDIFLAALACYQWKKINLKRR